MQNAGSCTHAAPLAWLAVVQAHHARSSTPHTRAQTSSAGLIDLRRVGFTLRMNNSSTNEWHARTAFWMVDDLTQIYRPLAKLRFGEAPFCSKAKASPTASDR